MKKNIAINIILLIYWAISLWLSGFCFGKYMEKRKEKENGNKN